MNTYSVILFLVAAAVTSAKCALLVPCNDEASYVKGAASIDTTQNTPAVEPRLTAEMRFNLARKYLKGEDIARDERKAFELMLAAANQGHVEALGGVGYFYANGIAVDKDNTLAIKWMRQGAEMGSAKAQLNLGLLLLNGTESLSSKAEGLKWIKTAADQRLVEAISAQGAILCLGLYDHLVDYHQAEYYLLQAAEKGHPESQHLLGKIFEKGWGQPANLAKAEDWYRKAAIQGEPEAQGDLARLLDPFNKNMVRRIEALTWLICSAEQNNPDSKKLLTDIYFSVTTAEMDLATKKASWIMKDVSSGP